MYHSVSIHPLPPHKVNPGAPRTVCRECGTTECSIKFMAGYDRLGDTSNPEKLVCCRCHGAGSYCLNH